MKFLINCQRLRLPHARGVNSHSTAVVSMRTVARGVTTNKPPSRLLDTARSRAAASWLDNRRRHRPDSNGDDQIHSPNAPGHDQGPYATASEGETKRRLQRKSRQPMAFTNRSLERRALGDCAGPKSEPKPGNKVDPPRCISSGSPSAECLSKADSTKNHWLHKRLSRRWVAPRRWLSTVGIVAFSVDLPSGDTPLDVIVDSMR